MTTPEELEHWLSEPLEGEHLEFKEAKQQFDLRSTVDYCVALANEGGGTLVLGVSDKRPRQVVGSNAFPNTQKIQGQLFEILHHRIDIDELLFRGQRVVVFRVRSRSRARPLHHDGRYLMRVGEQLVPMTPDQLERIFGEAVTDYSAEWVPSSGIGDLDPEAVSTFVAQWVRKSGNSHLAPSDHAQLLIDVGLYDGVRVNYAAVVLLGSPNGIRRHLPHAEVVFEYRSSEGSISHQQRAEFRQGFLAYHDRLWSLINLRNDKQSYQDGLFRIDIPTFDEEASREAILNAICHRDYERPESVFIRQYPRRLEVVSPGGFLPGITQENVLDRTSPRNRRIAEALARTGFVERSGQGMNRIFEHAVKQSKPLPDFTGTDNYQVSIALQGDIQRPEFIRFLEKIAPATLASFTTVDFLALDYIDRGEALSDQMKIRALRLIDLGVIERAGRRLILSRGLYAHMGRKGSYTRKKGLDHETNKALLERHIVDNGVDGSPLADLVQVLPNLGERRVQALLHELRAEKRIRVEGQRRWARWFPI